MSAATPFNKAITGVVGISAITVIVLTIIGLITTLSGPFNAIVQLGMGANGIFLGSSIFVFVLDLAWITVLCKKTKEPFSLPKPESLKQGSPSSALVPAVSEEIFNDTDFLSRQPQEILHEILRYLSPIELAKCGELSRKWRRLKSHTLLWDAFNLRKISPLLNVFDELDWAKYVDVTLMKLEMGDEPPLDKYQVIPFLYRCLSSLPIEGDAGITLLTIPKGTTFNNMLKFARSSIVGTKIAYILGRISSKIGDIPVDKTYRIVITNNVLKKSRDLSIKRQKALMKKTDCEMPRVLEATVFLVVATFMNLEKCPYTGVYTSCQDQIDGYHLFVGDFPPYGIYVQDNIDVGSDIIGAAGVLREF